MTLSLPHIAAERSGRTVVTAHGLASRDALVGTDTTKRLTAAVALTKSVALLDRVKA